MSHEKDDNCSHTSAKFPVDESPKAFRKGFSESSQTEEATAKNFVREGSNGSDRRFSCYDNLERSQAEKDSLEESDSDEDKISPPWDSRKWQHLMKVISESTQQLDLLHSVGRNNHSSNCTNTNTNTDSDVSQSLERTTTVIHSRVSHVFYW